MLTNSLGILVRKINILQMVTVSDIGGTERMLLYLLSAANKQRFRFVVACLYPGGVLKQEVQRMGVPFYDLSIKYVARLPFLLKTLIKKEKIDLIHTYGLTADVLIRPLARLYRVKGLISSIRSTYPNRKWYHNLLSRMTSFGVDVWISNSEAGKHAAVRREKIKPHKIVVIKNGIDVQSVPRVTPEKMKTIKEKLGLSKNTFVTLTVANLRPMKRHEDILKAIPLIKKKTGDKIKFIFVGTDNSRGQIAALAEKLGVQQEVIFAGFRKDIAPFLEMADLFLLTSEWEGLPGSILEAMAYRLPIIATNVGGIPELITHEKEGILIEPRNPQAIAANVIKLYCSKELRKQLGSNAYQQVAHEFTLSTMIARLEEIYEDLYQQKCVIAVPNSIQNQ